MSQDEAGGISVTLRLADGVRVGRDTAAGRLFLIAGPQRHRLPGPAADWMPVLRRLSAGELTEPRATDDTVVTATMDAALRSGLLVRAIRCGAVDLFTERALAVRVDGAPAAGTPKPDAVALSRFALLRSDGAGLVLESPLAGAVLRIAPGPMPGLLAELGQPVIPSTMDTALPPAALYSVLERLRHNGFLADGDTEDELTDWSPHELWFHARSRWGGRASADYVGPRAGPVPASPVAAVAAVPSGEHLDLPHPDLAAVRRADPPLTDVLEERRSIRSHDADRPLRLPALAEFLYRCARIRRTLRYADEEFTSRPYPAGGTAYELELYPVIGRVDGLTGGIYHYDAARHGLTRLPAEEKAVRALLDRAARTAMMSDGPQVLIVLAARFGRILPRYEGMGYATMLKNVGALYQTMYAVATAMGLAPCALGCGDTSVFAAATGAGYAGQSSVGEFLLGSAPVSRA